MIQKHISLPEELDQQIQERAKRLQASEERVIRELIEQGLKTVAGGSSWLKDLYEYLAPTREEALKKGLTEEEINAAIDKAVTAVQKKHATRRH